jgi:hypothetical protein
MPQALIRIDAITCKFPRNSRQPVRELRRYSTQMPPEAIRHSALRAFVQAALAVSAGSLSAKADVSKYFVDAAVNRKVDGTFTDMTLHITGSFG